MAIAYYPNRIRSWPVHQNLLDDVDASHVNNIQAELQAVMQSLGTSPQVYNNIETDELAPDSPPSPSGEVIDDDTMYTRSVRFYDPNIKPVDYGTLGARLDNIQRGTHQHAFALKANGLEIASKSTKFNTRPRGIRFPAPSEDPFNMFNGVGVTLRKAGFWMFSGSVVYNLQGSTAGSNNGIYQATIDHDGNYLQGMARSEETGNNNNPILNPILMGFFPRGTRVSLRSSHDSGRLQKIRLARFAGVLVRESIA